MRSKESEDRAEGVLEIDTDGAGVSHYARLNATPKQSLQRHGGASLGSSCRRYSVNCGTARAAGKRGLAATGKGGQVIVWACLSEKKEMRELKKSKEGNRAEQ